LLLPLLLARRAKKLHNLELHVFQFDSIAFDVYQWEKGDQYTLESEDEYAAVDEILGTLKKN
jgi:hypothetical protein